MEKYKTLSHQMTNYSATCILSWEVEICVQPLSKHVKASGNQTGDSPLCLVLSKLENWTGGLSTTGGKFWERWMGPKSVSQKHNHSFVSTNSKWVWPEPHCRPWGTKMNQIPNCSPAVKVAHEQLWALSESCEVRTESTFYPRKQQLLINSLLNEWISQ